MSPSAATYLTLALRELDICAIPGMGTFRKVSSPARPSDDGQLLPPVFSLAFEPAVAAGDPTLAAYLVAHHHLAEPDANRTMSDIKVEMVWALETRRKFDIQDLGLLMRSAEGSIVFVPYEANDPLGEQYGLAAVALPPAPPPVPPTTTTTATPAASPSAAPRTGSNLLSGFNLSNISGKMRTSLLVLLLIGFTGFSIYKAFQTAPDAVAAADSAVRPPFEVDTNRLFGRSRQLSAPETADTQPAQPAKAPAVVPNKPAATFTGTDSRLIAEAAPATQTATATRGIEADSRARMRMMRGVDGTTEEYGVVGSLSDLAAALETMYQEPPAQTRSLDAAVYGYPNSTARYHLIGGSFSTLDQANEAMAQGRSLGLHPLILFPETPDERFRVSLLQSESRAPLRDEYGHLKRSGYFKGAWVLERK